MERRGGVPRTKKHVQQKSVFSLARHQYILKIRSYGCLDLCTPPFSPAAPCPPRHPCVSRAPLQSSTFPASPASPSPTCPASPRARVDMRPPRVSSVSLRAQRPLHHVPFSSRLRIASLTSLSSPTFPASSAFLASQASRQAGFHWPYQDHGGLDKTHRRPLKGLLKPV